MSERKNPPSSETPPPPEGRDKRKSVRLEINAVTRFTFESEDHVGITKLINLGGILLEVDNALGLGSHLDIQLNLPSSLQPLIAKGEVVYRSNIRGRQSHTASEMGIKFTELTAPNEQLLREFTDRYHEFSLKHSVFSKEMSAFQDPTILTVNTKK